MKKDLPVTSAYEAAIAKRDTAMEFRIMTRITLHMDHAENLERSDFT